ncbi:UNVERIFIED_CONTAM: hypothetical protein HDU68_004733, partial [Siphonaria sp. JEL0065]
MKAIALTALFATSLTHALDIDQFYLAAKAFVGMADSGGHGFAHFSNVKTTPTGLDKHKGIVIKNVQVHAIYYGKEIVTYASQLNDFYSKITDSPWMDLMNQYGVERGSFLNGSFFMPTSTENHSNMTDSKIRALLLEMVKEGDINPTESTYFPIHFSAGTVITASDGTVSCNDWCGYHDYIPLNGIVPGAAHLYYGVIPDFGEKSHCRRGCGSGTALENLEKTAGHELAEVVTDPIPGEGWFQTSLGLSGEIADVCAGESTMQIGGSSLVAQAIWSNAAGR